MKTIITSSGHILYGPTPEFKVGKWVDQLLPKITSIVESGFGKQGDAEDVYRHVFGADYLGLIYEEDDLCGFATADNKTSSNLCYLHGISVATTARGIGSLLTREMFEQSGMDLFGLTTQNPSMYLAARKSSRSIFPSPQAQPNTLMRDLGVNIVANRRGCFQDTMAIYDLYPECLYPRIPAPNDDDLWRWWCQMIRIDESGKSNDGIVFVGEI